MSHLQLVLIAALITAATGCTATIDGYPYREDAKGNVRADLEADGEDAGAREAAGAPAPDPKPPAKPATTDAGSMAKPAMDAGSMAKPATMDAGTMQPPAAMPKAGSASTPPPMAGSAPPAPMPAACDFKGLIQAKCGSAGCHGGPSGAAGLDLTSASLAMRVAGRKGPSACSTKLLIDTENPAQSALYLKVKGTDCGTRMPLGGMLTADEQACVLRWIEGL